MCRNSIIKNVERWLYAESMGRCMNPNCQKELFIGDGDIIEKAHLVPYCETANNNFDNLVVLCPNCHTQFDKLHSFTSDEIRQWKQIRKNEVELFFCKKFSTFDELSKVVVPLLQENKTIYENYYLQNKQLWNKFESKILVNNKKIKKLFESNIKLFQHNANKEHSNLEIVYTFISHVDEFENTRADDEKIRQILFPKEIDSIFGISPAKESLLPLTESVECLIAKLNEQGSFGFVALGIDEPYIQLKSGYEPNKIFLNDIPRLRQLLYSYGCFKKSKVRLQSLNFALKYMVSRNIAFHFSNCNNLREIIVNGRKVIFIYEYCLSEISLSQLSPDKNSIVVNLHNWNGSSCISKQAYELSKQMNVTLLTMNEYYKFINAI